MKIVFAHLGSGFSFIPYKLRTKTVATIAMVVIAIVHVK